MAGPQSTEPDSEEPVAEPVGAVLQYVQQNVVGRRAIQVAGRSGRHSERPAQTVRATAGSFPFIAIAR